MGNERIHKTEKVINLIKQNNLVLFTLPPYSSELNKIKNAFGRIKKRISFANLNSKDFKKVIKEEISKLK